MNREERGHQGNRGRGGVRAPSSVSSAIRRAQKQSSLRGVLGHSGYSVHILLPTGRLVLGDEAFR
jgi:hypothetical protein